MIPNIEANDPNYNSHKLSFIFKSYENIRDKYNNLSNEVRMMCSGMRIKDYAGFLPDDNTPKIVKVKTILGIQLDFKKLDEHVVDGVYLLACEYGHLEIVKDYVDFKNGNLKNLDIEKAATSPNRGIFKLLKDKSQKYKELKKLLDNFKHYNFYEPKIRFV
jgi:hypothetical protein